MAGGGVKGGGAELTAPTLAGAAAGGSAPFGRDCAYLVVAGGARGCRTPVPAWLAAELRACHAAAMAMLLMPMPPGIGDEKNAMWPLTA